MLSPSFHEFMQACVAKVQEGALNRPIMRAEARGAGSTPRLGHVWAEKRQASSCTPAVDALLLQNLAVLLLLMLQAFSYTAVVDALMLQASRCIAVVDALESRCIAVVDTLGLQLHCCY